MCLNSATDLTVALFVLHIVVWCGSDWSFDDTHCAHGGTLSLWVALDDATLDNGCLFFIPGSHRQTEYTRNAGIGQNLGELFSLYPEWEGNPDMEPVAVPMKAGAASFHSGMTAHGAGANMTPGRRRAMTCGYMPGKLLCSDSSRRDLVSFT
jgi:phytanoyl-CoA hydroxylase